MKYLVVIHQSKYGYDIHVPALPGCHSQGRTEREALKSIQDAILTYLEMSEKEIKNSKLREIEITLPVA